jgi:hypothetical protein
VLLRSTYEWQLPPNGPIWRWETDETTRIEFGTLSKAAKKRTRNRRVLWEDRYIAIPYHRLLRQFLAEKHHGENNLGHEAQRRASYAARVLDAFGDELKDKKDLKSPGPHASAWRSKVLTPILQRQLWGVTDAYAPCIDAGVLSNDDKNEDRPVTISDATKFYLGRDPIPRDNRTVYVRNLVYTREMRWHLAVLLNKQTETDVNFFELTLRNQDLLMAKPGEISVKADRFGLKERAVLDSEGILDWTHFEGIINESDVGPYNDAHPMTDLAAI